jgi:hypothetical protein
MVSVIKAWVHESGMSLKQQTVLLAGCLRGCDGQSKDDVSKKIFKQMRSEVLLNAATPTTSFMSENSTVSEDMLKAFVRDKDKYPMHFLMHFVHAIELLGFYHPDEMRRSYYCKLYAQFVGSLHLNPETKAQNEYRLRDGVDSD